MSWLDHTEVSPSVYVVRFLDAVSDEAFGPFSGVCTVAVGRRVATVYGMCGQVRRVHLRALRDWLQEEGIHTLLAERVEGHRLPGAVRRDDGWMSIDLLAMKGRI